MVDAATKKTLGSIPLLKTKVETYFTRIILYHAGCFEKNVLKVRQKLGTRKKLKIENLKI